MTDYENPDRVETNGLVDLGKSIDRFTDRSFEMDEKRLAEAVAIALPLLWRIANSLEQLVEHKRSPQEPHLQGND